MSPTLPLANVAPPPARGGEAARLAPGGSEAARDAAQSSGESPRVDGDDFAHALRHAQRPDRPARPTHDSPHAKAAGAAAGQRPARAASGGRDVPAEPAQSADADVPCSTDAAARRSESPLEAPQEVADGDASTRPAQTGELPNLPPAVATDPVALPCSLTIAPRDTLPAAADERQTAAGIDTDGTIERAAPRSSGHDRRARAGTDRNATVPQSADDGQAAPTTPPRATPERTLTDAAPIASAGTHAPAFDAKALLDPGSLPAWHVAATPREASAAARSGSDSHLPHASVPAAIDDPAFGGALSHQVALWVRDGVQQARLHLHPAELGPVAVQIALDGQTARVDFTAPVAATRDSIEQSLPALAAALRESGFTLAGAGVSSHTGGRSHDAPPRRGLAGNDRSRLADVADATPAVAARRWTRSLLDVYA